MANRKRWIALSIILGAMASVAVATATVSALSQDDAHPHDMTQVQAAFGTAASAPLGTSFTYQGRLDRYGEPVNGDCQMAFRLYDQATGGSQVGATISATVPISDGLFTVTLDFGSGVFVGDGRWLGIQVQCPGDSAYADLGRQELTASPYALYAASTGALQGNPVTATVPAAGQVLEWDGSAWGPGADDDTTYTDGIGLDLGGGEFSIVTTYRLPQSCSGGQIAEWDGSGWQCGADDIGAGGTAWSLTGNSGTIPGTHFLGTTDGVSLTLVVSGTGALRLEPRETTPNVIGGYGGNTVSWRVSGATIGGGGASGYINQVSGDYGTIGGGYNNAADGQYATVGGGRGNTASYGDGTVGGGWGNLADGGSATVGGGRDNTARNGYATVGGGHGNEAGDYYATVGGGEGNTTSARYATIGGGKGINVTGEAATVAGGSWITVTGDYAAVGGGGDNIASGDATTISGGAANVASVWVATVGGGYGNVASGNAATVGGGWNNAASDHYATVGGGHSNGAAANYATVGGGYGNVASGNAATVGGGWNNTAANYATIGGGQNNTAIYPYATVPGGRDNTASTYSFAAGRRAKANNQGCFVWGDATDDDVACNNDNRTVFRSSGGFYIYTNPGLTSGGNSWGSVSDRARKENFAPVDTQALLAGLAEIPITTWNYTSQDPSIRHIGPVAQDFNGLLDDLGGEGEAYINTLDADGVALAAIQGLYAQNVSLQAKSAGLEQQNADLEARVAALESALAEGSVPSQASQANLLPWAAALLAGAGLAWTFRRREGLIPLNGGGR